jgi:hypothetical protein
LLEHRLRCTENVADLGIGELVDHEPAGAIGSYQSTIAQAGKMFGDIWLGEPCLLDDLPHGAGMLTQGK